MSTWTKALLTIERRNVFALKTNTLILHQMMTILYTSISCVFYKEIRGKMRFFATEKGNCLWTVKLLTETFCQSVIHVVLLLFGAGRQRHYIWGWQQIVVYCVCWFSRCQFTVTPVRRCISRPWKTYGIVVCCCWITINCTR